MRLLVVDADLSRSALMLLRMLPRLERMRCESLASATKASGRPPTRRLVPWLKHNSAAAVEVGGSHDRTAEGAELR